MDTCVRGFSFMPETKLEDLQFIEGEQLERTWKHSRRERLKEQEQKVWEEFVKEQDVVKVVYKDDPYQFLHQLPESCLKELMDIELQKALKEDEQVKKIEPANQGSGDTQREEPPPSVTFAEREECDMFHIFDDEKDDPSGPSGPEDEALNDSMGSPCTVRERDSENNSPVRAYERENNQSPENVSSVIESSIYCAKVKDLRLNIRDEILSIMATLDRQDVMTIERDEVTRMCRRSAEFTARFNRVYMYQLQRQMQEVKRNTLRAPPLARHTHFHAQLARLAALHHSLLQAFQIFHKSVEQTACVRESAALLHSLALAAREVSALGAAVPAPADLRAAAHIYDDEMLASCDKLDEAVCEHSLRVSDFLSTTDNTSRSPSRKCKGKGKRKMRALAKTTKSVPDTEARLSMYSLDTLRINLNAKTSKDNHSSGTSKVRGALSSAASKAPDKKKSPKSPKRSPRNRRPLMRAGPSSAPRRVRPPKDTEISTMVEAVETCTSSHMSREASPAATPRARRRPAAHTPRTATSANTTPRKSTTTTPRQKPLRNLSPKAKVRRSPKQGQILKALSSIQSDPRSAESHVQVTPVLITPVSKIQCAKKDVSPKRANRKADKILDKVERNLEKDKVAKYDDIAKNEAAKIEAAKNEAAKNEAAKIDKANAESSKDFDSVNVASKCESIKDLDSFRDFDSSKDSRKDCESNKETASSSKESKEVDQLAETPRSAREDRDGCKSEREKTRSTSMAPARCEVTRLLKQLCSGDAGKSRSERASGAKNAQLLCVNGGSPRQPSTPQLLRILEETIQKKAPKPMYPKPSAKDPERFRMAFNFPSRAAESLFQYRTRFVQHMLASSMYANSAVGKPWEMICSVSEKIIDELLLGCAKEMQMRDVLQELYNCETK